MSDRNAKLHAPATARNREPIAQVLREELPSTGLVLEVASGTGEHAVHFARAFPALDWQPSDADPDALASIAAWREEDGTGNLLPPITLDASQGDWPVAAADAVLSVNMVHISPPEAAEGLVSGAARILPPGGPLILYGPFLEDDVETAPSNSAFDRSLKARAARWGLRNVGWLDGLARAVGIERTRRVEMPANNLILIYRRQT